MARMDAHPTAIRAHITANCCSCAAHLSVSGAADANVPRVYAYAPRSDLARKRSAPPQPDVQNRMSASEPTVPEVLSTKKILAPILSLTENFRFCQEAIF